MQGCFAVHPHWRFEMKYLDVLAGVSSLAMSIIAAWDGEWGYALGLFGGFGAWTIVASRDWARPA